MEQRRPILQGEYKLLRIIEETDDSTVFLSQSIHTSERLYAIREYKVEGYEAPEQRALISSYFQPIAQGYMDFVHPCLTSLRNFFIENEYVYFVFDYIPGRRLSEILKLRQRPFTELQAIDISLKLAKALAYLHNLRPIKFFADMALNNVILTTNGYVMLTDYGLGKLLCKLTPESPRMGTLGYAAPEQIGVHGVVSRATDIYGLGVLMHELVTGADPRENPNHLKPIEEYEPGISQDYIDIVRQATQPNPTDRYLEVMDMVHALKSIAPERKRTERTANSNVMKNISTVLKAPFTK